MKKAPLPENEAEHWKALHDYNILDTPKQMCLGIRNIIFIYAQQVYAYLPAFSTSVYYRCYFQVLRPGCSNRVGGNFSPDGVEKNKM